MPYLAWLKLGLWHEHKGDLERAVLAFQAGLDEIPNDQDLKTALHQAQQKLSQVNQNK